MGPAASASSASSTSARRFDLVIVLDDPPSGTDTFDSHCLKIYSHLADDNEAQLTYFSSGFETYSQAAITSTSAKNKREITRYTDYLPHFNVKDRILAAYRWLSKEYQEGDRIFLFGFSRGAYAVRALSAMLDIVGLVKPDNEEQIPHGYDLFRTHQGQRPENTRCGKFKTAFSRKVPKIHFVGTFEAMMPPTSFVGFKPLPCVREYDNITHVRHAVAIDETRSKFSQPELYHEEGKTIPPNAHIKEVWFRGTHDNLGKASCTAPCGLTPLSWMEWEGMCAGLKIKADVPLGWTHVENWAGMRSCDFTEQTGLGSWMKEWVPGSEAGVREDKPDNRLYLKSPVSASSDTSPAYNSNRLDIEPWKSLLDKEVGDIPKRPPSGEPAYVDLGPFDPDDCALDYLCDEPVFEIADEAVKIACVLSAFLNQSHRNSIQAIPQGVIDWALIKMLEKHRFYWGLGGWNSSDPWLMSRCESKTESCVDAITRARPIALWKFLVLHLDMWKVDPLTSRKLCECLTKTFKLKMYSYESRRTNADGRVVFTPPEGLDGHVLWDQMLEIWNRTDPGFPDNPWDSEVIFEVLQRLAPFYPDLLIRDGPRIRDAVAQRRRVFENMARFNPERTYQALKWLFPIRGESPDIGRIIVDVVDTACRPFDRQAIGYDTYRRGDFGSGYFNAALWKVVAKMRGHPDPFEQPDWKTEEQELEALTAKGL